MLACIPLPYPRASSSKLPPTPTPPPAPFAPSHKRPRGLWKGRRDSPDTAAASHAPRSAQSSPRPSSSSTTLADDDDTAYDDDDRYSASSASSKRRRCSGAFDASTDSRPPSPRPRPASVPPLLADLPYHATHPRLPTLSRLAVVRSMPDPLSSAHRKGKQPSTADYEDWENLKELYARAIDRYDADDVPQALALLRAVTRECHRFLTVHPDPSVVYADPSPPPRSSPGTVTPTDVWAHDVSAALQCHPRPTERPAAFHALFGSALFHFGNLVAQDASVPLPDEPKLASDYWLAALDVFQTGENLPALTGAPSHSSGFADLTEDWRMAVIWGRTLVCLADEKLTHSLRLAKERATGDFCVLPSASPFDLSEPKWPKDSPFASIAACRPPVSRRVTLYSATAHDVMVLAMDQFSRGIFHMPHATSLPSHNTASHVHPPASPTLARQHSPPQPANTHDAHGHFSRPRELFTIASEVLGVAERLPDSAQRAYWASWADSVFTQMRMEAAHDAWRAPLTAARGRCWLIMGSAHSEELEAALEAGRPDVLDGAEASEAREGLAMAVAFFERAKGGAPGAEGEQGEEAEDVRPLLAEALFTLANLTPDENKREELYSRAQAEAGDEFMVDGDADGDTDPNAMELC